MSLGSFSPKNYRKWSLVGGRTSLLLLPSLLLLRQDRREEKERGKEGGGRERELNCVTWNFECYFVGINLSRRQHHRCYHLGFDLHQCILQLLLLKQLHLMKGKHQQCKLIIFDAAALSMFIHLHLGTQRWRWKMHFFAFNKEAQSRAFSALVKKQKVTLMMKRNGTIYHHPAEFNVMMIVWCHKQHFMICSNHSLLLLHHGM